MPAVDLLFHHLRHRAEAPAFVVGETTTTFGELDALSRRAAAGLAALGVIPGDRVACLLQPGVELVAAALGAWRLGAVHVPVNDHYGEVELSHILEDSGAVAVWTSANTPAHEVIARLSPPALRVRLVLGAEGALGPEERDAEEVLAAPEHVGEPPLGDHEPACFIHTSGTTGPSKGVVHSLGSLVAGVDALTRLWRWTEHDRLVLALPLFHVHGFAIGVLGTLLRGNVAELLRFDAAAVIDAVARGGSVFMGVPTMYRRLLRTLDAQPELAEGLRGARLFTSGSAALPAADFAAFEALTGHRILERYGMSETLFTLSNPFPPDQRVRGSIGFPVPGVDARVVDAEGRAVSPGQLGEIQVRGPNVMREYWGLPKASSEAFTQGWFRTGDLAVTDAEGRVFHRGRSGPDLIKSGGYRISAREIEELIQSLPEVDEVAVLGRPDPEWGQRIVAAIVPSSSASRKSEARWLGALEAALDGQLARYKRPREVRLIEALPRNALGKVQKHKLLQEMGG